MKGVVDNISKNNGTGKGLFANDVRVWITIGCRTNGAINASPVTHESPCGAELLWKALNYPL
jgi:hypothetical protein